MFLDNFAVYLKNIAKSTNKSRKVVSYLLSGYRDNKYSSIGSADWQDTTKDSGQGSLKTPF